MQASNTPQTVPPPIGAAIRASILFITLLSVPLSAAQEMNLTSAQTSSWILTIYLVPGVICLLLTLRYRQPLLLTGNIFILIFVSTLAGQVPYAEWIGASIVAGLVVIAITWLGITGQLSRLIPAPVVLGLLAGAVTPLVLGIFTSLVEAPVIVGSTFLAYLIGRRWLGTRLPAILPAVIVGLLVTAFTAQFGQAASVNYIPQLTITAPVFSLSAIASITPIFVILITLQANLPSMIFMQNQNFAPPERFINTVTGIGTVFGAFLGPMGVSLSLPLTSLVASDIAGEYRYRHRAVYYAGTVSVLIGLLAGVAAVLLEIIPLPLLNALAGLAMFDVLLTALLAMMGSPLRLGPIFAFVITLSQVTFLGLGAFFWAIVVGTGISISLEPDELKQLREQETEKL